METINKKLRSQLATLIILIITGIHATAFGQDYSFAVEKIGSGKPVIFIPGLISSGEVWQSTAQQLADDYECHILTLPGYAGQAPLSDAPYLESFKLEILKYIKENQLKDVQLVGHSIGGFISMLIALENQRSIQQLVIVDALPFFAQTFSPNPQTGFNEQAAKQYMDTFRQFDEAQVWNYRKQVAQSMTKREEYWDKMVDWAMQSDAKTEAYSSHEMLGNDIREKLRDIKIPITVFAAHDENPDFPTYTKQAVEETYLAQYQKAPNLQLIIAEGSRHFIMLDQEEWFHQQLLSVLK